eukprot:3734230-Pyramimonas_sp.AAC.1
MARAAAPCSGSRPVPKRAETSNFLWAPGEPGAQRAAVLTICGMGPRGPLAPEDLEAVGSRCIDGLRAEQACDAAAVE